MSEPLTRYSATLHYRIDLTGEWDAPNNDVPVYLASAVDARDELNAAEFIKAVEVAHQLEADVARLTQDRDEYKALASVGAWHADCRPNRRKAAGEIQKSQQRIDALAAEVARLTRELAEARRQYRPEYGTEVERDAARAQLEMQSKAKIEDTRVDGQ